MNCGRHPRLAAMHIEPAARWGNDNDCVPSTSRIRLPDAGTRLAAPNHSHNPNTLRNREAAIGTE